MKNAGLIAGIVLASVVLTSSSVLAMGPGDGPRFSFTELDADGDGKIAQEEMLGHRAERLARADTDGDGALSRSELEAEAQARASARVAHMLERLDSDKDGQFRQNEMPEPQCHGAGFVGRQDSDGDGAISEQEFAQMQERMKARHGRHGFGDKMKH
ncbi:EF-hand domain-containing protein [Ruegeria marina]|uniref:EF hand n=1 Tax=Ruegeria marina TaxID=639004 RepID=A0A1G7D7W8_9RHOB|nr:EF-hand domain-containing protein [Ruegeria marina]SDE47662.1 EF hand [Ruegeria marina]